MNSNPTLYTEVHTESNLASPKVVNPQDGDQAFAHFGNNNWTTVVYVDQVGWVTHAAARKIRNETKSG